MTEFVAKVKCPSCGRKIDLGPVFGPRIAKLEMVALAAQNFLYQLKPAVFAGQERLEKALRELKL